MSTGVGSFKVSLSPDRRKLAIPVFNGLEPVGVRRVAGGTSELITSIAPCW